MQQEIFSLTIKENRQSYFCSENFSKADSIRGLMNSGLISSQQYMSSPKYRFRSAFMKFISKSYDSGESRVFEKIAAEQFEFRVKNNLKWEIGTETDSISGYACTKATTFLGGRHYVAWFTSEIPITDGPYLFWGLPGLIVKISYTKNHYDFTLVQFVGYTGQIKEWPAFANTRKTIESTAANVFAHREEVRKDPLAVVDRLVGPFTVNGVPSSDKSIRNKRSWDNNPIELRAPLE
ncbi:GLPGLI family protein [Dyadobacter psychrotolerans]|uniref:GLPGLI family protein n=1 Tax=Dyadobacter psychrotolerans TaxID=2541721 RepID=A0A4R5DW47_9BACT|nr:GLPGLI family protein [Dyadobacter psychrotolerans]